MLRHCPEAGETLWTSFRESFCKATAESNKQLACVGNSEVKERRTRGRVSSAQAELEIRQRVPPTQRKLPIAGSSCGPRRQIFPICSTSCRAPSELRAAAAGSPAMPTTDWPSRRDHTYTYPPREARRSYTNITSWWAPQSTSKWITGWTRPALN